MDQENVYSNGHGLMQNHVPPQLQQPLDDGVSSESGSNNAVYVESAGSGASLNSSNASIPSALSSGRDDDDSNALRAMHNSGASRDSSSEGDFVRFGQDELAEIPANLLADYSNRMAYDVLHQITNGDERNGSIINGYRRRQQQQQEEHYWDEEEQQGVNILEQQQSPLADFSSTPVIDELASPISNYMEQNFIIQDHFSNSSSADEHSHNAQRSELSMNQQNQLDENAEPLVQTGQTHHHEVQQEVQSKIQPNETLLNYSGSEFDPLAGRIAHANTTPHDNISNIQFYNQEIKSSLIDDEVKQKLNNDDSIIIRPDEERQQSVFDDTDRPEIVPVGESESLKAVFTDADTELLMELAPHTYEKPTETDRETSQDVVEPAMADSLANKSIPLSSQYAVNKDVINTSNVDLLGSTWDDGFTTLSQKSQIEAAPSSTASTAGSSYSHIDPEREEESDHDDTLASLPSESKVHGDVEAQSPGDESTYIPESSSITGMRDFTADNAEDEETLIQARGGRPLVIPLEVMTAAGVATVAAAAAATDSVTSLISQTKDKKVEESLYAAEYKVAQKSETPNIRDDDLPISSKWPIRPPTPPKSFENSEDNEDKPSVVDLGPPPPSHFLVHRPSVSGLHSILKRPEDKAWISGVTDPTILELVYWRDPKRSGIALAACLLVLYLFSQCTVLSVFAYTALLSLSAAIGFRVFKLVEARFKNTDGSNPFKQYLEQEVVVPQEKLHAQVEVFVEHAQCAFKCLRHLFLVENLVDSVKFGLLLHMLTYIGAWFSGLTLAFFFVVGLFATPKIYETNKEPIDHYVAIVQEQLEKIQNTVEDKLPFLKKQVDAEKKEH